MFYITFLATQILLLQITAKRETKYLFKILYIFFFALLSIRFGQGTDYFNYKRIFAALPANYDNFFVMSYLSGIEPFYYLINIFAKQSSLGFPFVVFISTSIMGYFNYKAIIKYSDASIFSFFILYANYFFYLHTAIRQGVAISITTYAILSFLSDKKVLKYALLIFCAMMFHTSAFICLCVPFFLKIGRILRLYEIKKYILFALICSIFGFFAFKIMIGVASMILPRYKAYSEFSANLFAIFPLGIRFIFAIMILHLNMKCESCSQKESNILVLYLLGTIFFDLLFTSNQASRLTDYFTIFEIVLFPKYHFNKKYKKSFMSSLVVLLFSLLFIKDLNAFQNQGDYFSKNPFFYPYISIFNKAEILNYRGDLEKYSSEFIFSNLP